MRNAFPRPEPPTTTMLTVCRQAHEIRWFHKNEMILNDDMFNGIINHICIICIKIKMTH